MISVNFKGSYLMSLNISKEPNILALFPWDDSDGWLVQRKCVYAWSAALTWKASALGFLLCVGRQSSQVSRFLQCHPEEKSSNKLLTLAFGVITAGDDIFVYIYILSWNLLSCVCKHSFLSYSLTKFYPVICHMYYNTLKS